MKEKAKAFGLALWSHVGKPTLAMLLASLLIKNTGLDQLTASTIGHGAAAAVDTVVTGG